MERLILSLTLICIFTGLYAQQTVEGISSSKSYNITKEVKPPILTITNGSLIFTDANNNKAIDAGEDCKIIFQLENNGMGDGFGLELALSASGSTQGLTYKSTSSLQTLNVGQKSKVEIPVTANMNTTDGKVVFTLKVDEPNGFGTDAYQLEVSTRSFVSPLVEVVDYTITSNQSGVLAKKIPFDLQILVQNTKQGYADNVKVTLSLPEGVFCLTGNETLDYSGLQAGEKKSIVYNLIVNDKFVGTSIPIKIKVSEKYNKYAKDKDISLSLNESMSSTKIEVLAENKQNNINIQIGSLSSDVDKNIPLNNLSYTNRYALIIGNEDYSSWQKGLSTEINVDYAENDARIFKEYCVKTMGIPEKQVKLLSNATSSQMSQGLAWLNNLAKVENGKAELIFYYSGHGLPDEQTKESYLIPVDVSGSNITQGLKIADVYSKLTEYPSQKVTVFLDACFSGGARNQALIAQKTVKINPKKEQIKGNLIVFTSSSGEESSGVYREQKHGFFTYYLLKKLQETKGDVTYNELNNYIKASVSKETSLIGKPQNPEVLVSPQIENSWSNWKIK